MRREAMALRFENVAACVSNSAPTRDFLETDTRGASTTFVCSRARRHSDEQTRLRVLAIGEGRRSTRVASLAAASHFLAFESRRDAEPRNLNSRDARDAVKTLPFKENENGNEDEDENERKNSFPGDVVKSLSKPLTFNEEEKEKEDEDEGKRKNSFPGDVVKSILKKLPLNESESEKVKEEDEDEDERKSSVPREAVKSIVKSLPLKEKENEDEETCIPSCEEEDGDGERTVVSEVILDGDDLRVVEYQEKDEAEREAHPVNAVADALLNKLSDDGRGFSLTDVGGIWKTGENAGQVKVPDMSLSGFDVKDGVSPLAQWTSIEITMQHSQLARIATDVRYLQRAFLFFGAVRVVEALMSVFSTTPPDYGKCKELLNALDPFTIAWLAHNLRQPIEGMVSVDPLDLERVIALKSGVWEELHKFYERQWKVMATLAMARTLSIVAIDIPSAEVVTSKVKFLWDALMALPVF